jgi:hypothetical protein
MFDLWLPGTGRARLCRGLLKALEGGARVERGGIDCKGFELGSEMPGTMAMGRETSRIDRAFSLVDLFFWRIESGHNVEQDISARIIILVFGSHARWPYLSWLVVIQQLGDAGSGPPHPQCGAL